MQHTCSSRLILFKTESNNKSLRCRGDKPARRKGPAHAKFRVVSYGNHTISSTRPSC